MRHSWLRFGVEFLFIVAVAVVAGVASLRPLLIIVVMAVAWLLVAAYEWTASRQPVASTAEGDRVAEAPAAEPPAAPEQRPRRPRRGRGARAGRPRPRAGRAGAAAGRRPARAGARPAGARAGTRRRGR